MVINHLGLGISECCPHTDTRVYGFIKEHIRCYFAKIYIYEASRSYSHVRCAPSSPSDATWTSPSQSASRSNIPLRSPCTLHVLSLHTALLESTSAQDIRGPRLRKYLLMSTPLPGSFLRQGPVRRRRRTRRYYHVCYISLHFFVKEMHTRVSNTNESRLHCFDGKVSPHLPYHVWSSVCDGGQFRRCPRHNVISTIHSASVCRHRCESANTVGHGPNACCRPRQKARFSTNGVTTRAPQALHGDGQIAKASIRLQSL